MKESILDNLIVRMWISSKLSEKIAESIETYLILLLENNQKSFTKNGWFAGNVMYYNKCLKELEVDFPDGTVDYISPEDVDKDVFLN